MVLGKVYNQDFCYFVSEKRVPKASLPVQIFEFNQLETLLLLQGTRQRLESAQFSHDTNTLRFLQE